MRRHRRRAWSPFTVGAIAIGLIAALTYLGFTKAIPFRQHFEVKAVFSSSNNLRPNSPVRIAGIDVGKVAQVEHLGEGEDHAVVTMRINENGRPIREDATFAIRPRIFLEGNFFVDVTPGSPSAAPLEDGDVVPVTQTRTPVQFDQLLTALQSDSREDLKVLLKEYGDALDKGGAEGFNRSIRHWAPAYRSTAQVNDALQGIERHDLSRYVANAGRVSAALDRNRQALKSLITDFHITARAFAREDGALSRAIAELPRTLRAAHPALGSLNRSFPPLRRLVADLRPAVRSSGPTIDASMPLVRQLRGLVSEPELRGLTRDLRASVPALNRLNVESPGLFRQMRRASSCQNDVILPWSDLEVPDDTFPAKSPVYQEFGKSLVGLGGESRSGDANGQWFRILINAGQNVVTLRPGVFASTAFPILGANPPPSPRPPLRPDVPCETQEIPDLDTNPAPPPPQTQIRELSPEARALQEKSLKAAIKRARESLRREGLADSIKVTERPATGADIARAREGGGR